MTISQAFSLKNRKISPPLALAPMVGLSHSALRTTVLGFGGVGLLFTEMLATRRLPSDHPSKSPYLIRTDRERPLSYQLLLHEPATIGPAIEALHRLGADAVDLNLGCPAPRVRDMGGGSALTASPTTVAVMVREVRQRWSLPLSAKIRLGERLNEQWLKDFCLMLQGEGVDLITVHARLQTDSFARPPRWDWVGKVKEWLDIPVLANGGIDSVASARACLAASGADGLMIGRAAAIRPWIFAEIARDLYGGPELALPPLPSIYRQFALALEERFLPERRLGRLKEFTHYFARNYAFGHHLASAVQSAMTMEQARERADNFFARNGREGQGGDVRREVD